MRALTVYLAGGQAISAAMPDNIAQAFVAKWVELANDRTSVITFGDYSTVRPTAIDAVVSSEPQP